MSPPPLFDRFREVARQLAVLLVRDVGKRLLAARLDVEVPDRAPELLRGEIDPPPFDPVVEVPDLADARLEDLPSEVVVDDERGNTALAARRVALRRMRDVRLDQ